MKRYEIINPSDACFISSDEPVVAAACVLFLGEGAYGCKDDEGGSLPTFFLFGGQDMADKAWSETFGTTIDAFLKPIENRIKMAAAFETFKYADERTSLNNIGDRAAWMARNLRGAIDKAAAIPETL